MVKVEGLTDREVALREKTSKLLEMTEETLGIMEKQRINQSSTGSIHIKHRSPQTLGSPIVVSPDMNQVSVESFPYLGEAMKLAIAYEDATGEEFTVKKLYGR